MTTEQLLNKLDEATKDKDSLDRSLYHLLKAHESQIEGLIEEDSSGYHFHKAFRSFEVTRSGHIDAAIWILLKETHVFWDILHEENELSIPKL